MITFESLQKDILELKAMVIRLQDRVVAQNKRIKELEKATRYEPLPHTPCNKCLGTGQYMTSAGIQGRKVTYKSIDCTSCKGSGRRESLPKRVED